jgi:hypothetical protein
MLAKSYGRYSSYTLKHCLEDDEFYITNGEFRVLCSPPVTSQKTGRNRIGHLGYAPVLGGLR